MISDNVQLIESNGLWYWVKASELQRERISKPRAEVLLPFFTLAGASLQLSGQPRMTEAVPQTLSGPKFLPWETGVTLQILDFLEPAVCEVEPKPSSTSSSLFGGLASCLALARLLPCQSTSSSLQQKSWPLINAVCAEGFGCCCWQCRHNTRKSSLASTTLQALHFLRVWVCLKMYPKVHWFEASFCTLCPYPLVIVYIAMENHHVDSYVRLPEGNQGGRSTMVEIDLSSNRCWRSQPAFFSAVTHFQGTTVRGFGFV